MGPIPILRGQLFLAETAIRGGMPRKGSYQLSAVAIHASAANAQRLKSLSRAAMRPTSEIQSYASWLSRLSSMSFGTIERMS
jgi:hypothetical protein